MSRNRDRSEQFKVRDASSYDAVTEEFDRYAERYSTPLAMRVVALAQLEPSDRVLDVGTGTGIVALTAARALGQNGRVVGIDLSDGMLRMAKEKAAATGLSERVEFGKMDGEALDFDDQSFDAVVSLFTLLHFPHPEIALRQMYRVLRPGGCVVVGLGSGPPILSLAGLARRVGQIRDFTQRFFGRCLTAPDFLNQLVERHLVGGDQPEESVLAGSHLGRPSSVRTLVKEAGFARLHGVWQGHRAEFDTAEEFWELQATYSSFARKRLARAEPEAIQALKKEFLTACRAVQERGGRLVYSYAALFVVGRRPRP